MQMSQSSSRPTTRGRFAQGVAGTQVWAVGVNMNETRSPLSRRGGFGGRGQDAGFVVHLSTICVGYAPGARSNVMPRGPAICWARGPADFAQSILVQKLGPRGGPAAKISAWPLAAQLDLAAGSGGNSLPDAHIRVSWAMD